MKGIILPSYKASFAARLPVGGVMQMRVPVRHQPPDDATEVFLWYPPENRLPGEKWAKGGLWYRTETGLFGPTSEKPHKPGDVVFGKERWKTDYNPPFFYYEADDSPNMRPDVKEKAWKAARLMPREYARLFFRVRSVRVERLQDIAGQPGWTDIRVEGVDCPEHDFPGGFCVSYCKALVDKFRELWDAHHKRHPWKSNPWVWVNELERTERP